MSAEDHHLILSQGNDAGRRRTPEDEELAKLFGGLTHPTMMRLHTILKSNDSTSTGELEHIAICPDCVARVRAFRRTNDEESRDSFFSRMEGLHPRSTSESKYARSANTDARIFYAKLEQDADLDRWQHDAWRCSHTIARALRHARDEGATTDDLRTIIVFRIAALGASAANPMVACSRRFDGAWPIAEMIKEAATEVGFIGPQLFDTFAESVASAVQIASPRMQVVLTYAAVELLGTAPSALAVKIVRKIAAADSAPGTRIVLAALLYRRSPVGAELSSILSGDFVNEARVHAGFRTLIRRWHKVEQILNDDTVTLQTGIDRVVVIVRRYIDDVLDADEPHEGLLRLIAFRRFLDRTGRYQPDNHFPMTELLRVIGQLLVAVANERHGSTFLLTKALEVIRDASHPEADPYAYTSLAERLPSVRPVVRQGLISCAAAGYETLFRATLQPKTPAFVRKDSQMEFVGGATPHRLDFFCRKAAQEAASHPELNTHLEWMTERMNTWTSSVGAAVRS